MQKRGFLLKGRKEEGWMDGQITKMNVQTTSKIKEIIDRNPTITQLEISEQLSIAHQQDINNEVPECRRIQAIKRSSVGNAIHNLGYSLKRITKQPVPRNTELGMKKWVLWGEFFIKLVDAEVQFIFIDECGFSRGQSRNYGYAEVRDTPQQSQWTR